MDVFDAIRLRRSIKPDKLRADPIERSLLDQLFEAANWAPSHGRTEPWRFIVFTGDARRRLADAVLETGVEGRAADVPAGDPRREKVERSFLTPPVTIAIVCARPTNPKIEPHEDLLATGIAVQNMMLTARALGLATFWSSGAKAFHPRMAEFLGLEPGARCLGFLFVGRPAVEWPDAGERRPAADKVTWREG